jgi:hypothetical protein
MIQSLGPHTEPSCGTKSWQTFVHQKSGDSLPPALRLLMGEIRDQTMLTSSCSHYYKLALYHLFRDCNMLQCYITSL